MTHETLLFSDLEESNKNDEDSASSKDPVSECHVFRHAHRIRQLPRCSCGSRDIQEKIHHGNQTKKLSFNGYLETPLYYWPLVYGKLRPG
ncbi:hypothetical protein CEXT_360301 [Caerostris extrusa]|uniref:Uncharacterized protein n=1 Tax=Caerostris extrusa TaxID=172846 RepID=A0AAV4UX61_CAEEX|nr:hypothetical protein CEXT_360301 [Caerostris extrusa]